MAVAATSDAPQWLFWHSLSSCWQVRSGPHARLTTDNPFELPEQTEPAPQIGLNGRGKGSIVELRSVQRQSGNGQFARSAMAYVLAGGRGSRLVELTDIRAKPAVYFGGKSRIIDFALSNALNSGIRHIGVATQYKAHSLIRHLQRGWNFLRPERNESFDILPASQRVSETQWYLGTADAVYQNWDIIQSYGPEYLVVLAGDHVYKMDYSLMLAQHVESGADVTVGCIEVPRLEATAFGVMHIDENGRIVQFLEKPKDPPAMPGKPDVALASMGIYVFHSRIVCDLLARDADDPNSSHDFGKDLIPYIVKHGKAVAHRFDESCVRSSYESKAYWRDVGTVDAYWEANIDLTDPLPSLDLFDRDWPIWTYAEITPPAKFVHDEEGRRGKAVSSLVSGGCIVSGSKLKRTLLFTGVRVHSYSMVEASVILPYAEIGQHVRLKNVVIDRGVHIPDGLVVGEDPVLDAQRFRRTDKGICLITMPMINRLAALAA
jgi:glucose-1-phosphate adenylyltransferase